MVNVPYSNLGLQAAVFPSGASVWSARFSPSVGNMGGTGGNAVNGETIAAGSTRTGGVYLGEYWTVAPGTYQVTVKVDKDNKVAETNESNNESTCTLTVAASSANPPDLIITSATLNPPGGTVQEDLYFDVVIKNQGASPAYFLASSYPYLLLSAPNLGLYYVYVPSAGVTFAPGEAKTYQMALGSPVAGAFTTTITVNPSNRTYESDHANNRMTVSGTIGAPVSPKPRAGDLVPVGCTFTPASPKTSDRVDISITVKNTGFWPVFIPKGAREWWAQIVGRPGGVGGSGFSRTIAASTTYGGGINGFVQPGTLPAGTYDVLLSVDDATNRIGESNDSNNQVTCKLVISN